MVSFQRMRDELDSIEYKLPVIGKAGCLTLAVVSFFVLFIIGFAIGYGVSNNGVSDLSSSEANAQSSPNYIFVSNNSQSCPPLVGERLLTTMRHGQSFEGLTVNLACRGDYNAFPNQVKCRRRQAFGESSDLEWSHIPVCYPSVLVSKTHWAKTLHARSVSCTGNSGSTDCKLSCIRDYIAVEETPYRCTKPPCRVWDLGNSKCFMCDKKCDRLHQIANPHADALVNTLQCSCSQIIVDSRGKAAIWQNKRTGLFTFLGEHNERPVYQNKATKEFLFFTFTGSEWLVGPDFRKPHAGIQVFGNENTRCPEKFGGKNISQLYIDSSEPSPGGTGKWTKDTMLSFKCMTDDYRPVTCGCKKYKVYHTVYNEGEVPDAVGYLSGNFERIDEKEMGLLAPLYFDKSKQLYLFSHHPKGLVWQVSTKLSTTPMRGVLNGIDSDDNDASVDESAESCPDNDFIKWEWFNSTTSQGQQLYVKDEHIQVKCIS